MFRMRPHHTADSTKCPNCGHKYGEATAKVPSKKNGDGIMGSFLKTLKYQEVNLYGYDNIADV